MLTYGVNMLNLQLKSHGPQKLKHTITIFLATFVCSLLTTAFVASAQDAGQAAGQSDDTRFALHATAIHQSGADLDGGGDFDVSRYWFRLNAIRRIHPSLTLGLSVNYDYDDYDFNGLPRFAGMAPWDDTHRLGFSLPARITLAPNWYLMVAPSLEFSAESGADWQDGLLYGGVVSLSYSFGRHLTLGGGIGAFSGLEETTVFPYLVVRWQITDQLRLTNPLPVGPAGPAGLELIYAIDRNWEVGTGAAYRTYRFRLDGNGIAPNGIGHADFIPVWGRISRKIATRLKLDLYLGGSLGGELSLDDHSGTQIARDDHDPSALLAVTLTSTF